MFTKKWLWPENLQTNQQYRKENNILGLDYILL